MVSGRPSRRAMQWPDRAPIDMRKQRRGFVSFVYSAVAIPALHDEVGKTDDNPAFDP